MKTEQERKRFKSDLKSSVQRYVMSHGKDEWHQVLDILREDNWHNLDKWELIEELTESHENGIAKWDNMTSSDVAIEVISMFECHLLLDRDAGWWADAFENTEQALRAILKTKAEREQSADAAI